MSLLVVPLLVLCAGSGDALYGDGSNCVPKGVKTFEVVRNGELLGYAGIRYRGEWLEESDLKAGGRQVELVFDTPWAPAAPDRIMVNDSYAFSGELLSTERIPRLEKGWRDAGFVLVNGIYIPKQEQRKVEQAAQMVAEQRDATPAPILKSSDIIESPPKPSLVEQFWLHALILAGGLTILGVLVKMFFLP